MGRKFIALLGPTNSGKTHRAMEHLTKAGSGVYLAPLRLLAAGTLLANNTVQVDGARTGTVGVGLSSSADVVLESNRIETEKITELDERSNVLQ